MRIHPLANLKLDTLHPPIPMQTSGATAQDLRATNLSTVLHHVLAAPGTATRAAIAASTGSTRATVSRLVDELVSLGIVTESAPKPTSGRGRPAICLNIAPKRVCALGLEVKVDTLKAQLVDLNGSIIAAAESAHTPNATPQETLTALYKLAKLLFKTTPKHMCYVGSALALPGLVSPAGMAYAPNLDWHDLSYEEIAEHLADLAPRLIGNEADLAAFRVATPSPGVFSDTDSFIFLSGEVGVGCGVVLRHRSISGENGWAGEFGHISVVPEGSQCTCGSYGCLETFLGRRALARRAHMDETSEPADVIARALSGDEAASNAIRDAGTALGRALAMVINILDIHTIILGGNLAELADSIEPYCRRELTRFSHHARLEQPNIVTVDNSEDYSVQGAAHRILHDFILNPAGYIAHSLIP